LAKVLLQVVKADLGETLLPKLGKQRFQLGGGLYEVFWVGQLSDC
jgi:hypothetical protein